MKKTLLLSPLFLSLLLLNNGCTPQSLYPTEESVPALETVIDLSSNTSTGLKSPTNIYSLPTVQGTKITIKEYPTGFDFPQFRGKTVLLEVFGKHCEYCFEELPIIHRLQREYPNRLAIVAIQAQEAMSPREASELIQTHNMHYPIIDREPASDLLVELSKKYEWTGVLPFILLIKDGVVQYAFKEGHSSYEELQQSINETL